MDFNPAVVERFVCSFEAVAGVAHVAATVVDAADTVLEIIAEKRARVLALANLPDRIVDDVARRAVEAGIDVLKEPYPAESLPGLIDKADVGVTGMRFGIAQTGTLVEVAVNDAVRLVSALPRTHIGVVCASDLVEHYNDAAPLIRAIFTEHSRNCVVSFMSGPSRTGDIELKLTLGVHGPESAHAIILLE